MTGLVESRVGTTALLGLAAAFGAVDVAIAVTAGLQSPLWYATEIGVAILWVVVGVVATLIHPVRRIGLLMGVLGLILLVNAPAGFELDTSNPLIAADLVLARAVLPFQLVVFAHLLLTYPDGPVHRGVQRAFVAAAFGYATLVGIIGAVGVLRDVTRPGWSGAEPEAGFGGSGSVVALDVGWLAFAAVYVVLLWRRVRGVTPARRRTLAYPLGCGMVLIALFAVQTLLTASDVLPVANDLADLLPYLAVATLPGAFLLGLVRERVRYGLAADLVRELADTPTGEMEQALRRVLSDPTLRLAAVHPDGPAAGHVDRHGTPIEVPGDSSVGVLRIGDALLLHDPALRDEPRLLEAAAAALRLALDNARLAAEANVTGQRVIAAVDDERRRLERDLHDGPQQRMLAVGIALRLLEQRLDLRDSAIATAVAEVHEELSGAIKEMRELARGVYPAVLIDDGISAAVRTLVRRQPFAVDLDDTLAGRLPAAVEQAAYFVVAEALSNVAKHARAGSARVRLAVVGDRLQVEVSDDGVGGADVGADVGADFGAGSGLRGLAERAQAIGGSLSVGDASPGGTRLQVELPCAW